MSFTNPGAWLLASLLAVLIVLHLRERARRPLEVPSLLLWAQIVTPPQRRQMRWNWLLVVQGVLLLALVAGLAGPYVSSAPAEPAAGRTVFVLDCSASMQAREGARTRFEDARRTIAERLAALPAGHEVMLIAARHRPQVVVPPTVDRDAVQQALATLEAGDTRADLDAALAVARGAIDPARPTRIELHSDVRRELLSPAWRDLVSTFPVGETDDNVAIEGIQLVQSRFDDPRAARAFVSVRNFAGREAHGWLTLQLDDAVVARRGFTLAPRSASGIALPAVPGPGILRAALEVNDALPVDNIAAAHVRPLQPMRVRVVTDDPNLRRDLTRIARSVAALSLELVEPGTPLEGGDADVTIFHRIAPPPAARGASLYIAPRGGLFPSAGERRAVIADTIEHGHAALTGLHLELPFPLARTELLGAPPGTETLIATRIDGETVPLLMVDSGGDRRHAVLAFDIAEDGLLRADHLELLLLFLNLLDWLAPPHETVRIVPTGTTEVIDALPPEPRHITDPRGAQATLPADRPVLLDTPWAGEYRVAANGTEVRVLAQLLDPVESDIGRPPAVPSLVSGESGGLPPLAPTEPAARPWLYAIGLALLLVEWQLARRMT